MCIPFLFFWFTQNIIHHLIFQNNRGKKPSHLEIIKAQFMFNVHLYGAEEKESLIEEIKNRFEKIYKSISSIEYRIYDLEYPE